MPIADIVVGTDRIMLTAFNPRSELTLLKCRFVLERIAGQPIPEAEFRSWLSGKPGGAELLARLDAGWQPLRDPELSIDPRNATEEARIVAYLQAEYAAQTGR